MENLSAYLSRFMGNMREALGKVCGSLGDVCGGLGKVVDCEVYINFKNICFKNSENHVGRNLIFVKSMKNNILRNLV